jgi:UDP-glucose 6-dehydrogenase
VSVNEEWPVKPAAGAAVEVATAELIKYATNAFLATKITRSLSPQLCWGD